MTWRPTTIAIGFLVALTGSATAAPTALPQTTALRHELDGVRQDLTSLADRLERVEESVEDARKKVEAASNLVKALDAADDKLARVIREAKPLSGIPQLRVLRPLVTNLEQIRKQVHAARVKADQANKDVLRPLAARLRETERDLTLAVRECDAAAGWARAAELGMGFAQDGVEARGRPQEVAPLERAAAAARRGTGPLETALAELDVAAGAAEKEAVKLATAVKAVTLLSPGLVKLNRDLTPVDKAAGELGKVMSKKVAVKLFGKEFGFTVRQVLEGPGKIADFALKPLMALADKATAGVLKKLKLQVPAPRGLGDLNKRLAAVATAATRLDRPFDRLGESLDTAFLDEFRDSIAALPEAPQK